MGKKTFIFSLLALAACAALLAGGARGSGGDTTGEGHEAHEHEVVRDMAEQGDILQLEQILQHARQHRAGRVLEIELEHKADRLVYEVEILDDRGEVWSMNFDARSGELLEEGQED